MRNKYLNNQRKKMKELKEYFERQKIGGNAEEKNNQHIEMNIDMAENETEKTSEPKGSHFKPGVILKIKLPEPCQDTKKLKVSILIYIKNKLSFFTTINYLILYY